MRSEDLDGSYYMHMANTTRLSIIEYRPSTIVTAPLGAMTWRGWVVEGRDGDYLGGRVGKWDKAMPG